MAEKQIVIVDGVRTPQGTLGGSLKDFTSQKLGELVVRAVLERTKLDPTKVDNIIFGCVGQSSDAPNIARVIGLMAGLPKEVPGFTVARNCASGVQAIVSAYQSIYCGESEIVLAGGAECMSAIPYVNRDMRFGKKLQDSVFVDGIWEGLTDPVCGQLMGMTAENLAEEFSISREDQDAFAIESHQKAFKATREGRFKDEIVNIEVEKKVAGKKVAAEPFTQDEGVNIALNAEMLKLYPTVFKREGGTVTPGNACPISDGAACVLMMTEEKAKELGLEILGYIRSYGFAGVEPERMGIGPAHATPIALERAGLKLEDMELIEVNEAFAAQYLSVEKKLGLNRDIVNVNGGAIALGHPVGATGVRITVTLLHEMKRRGNKLGLATLCVGGGLGGALVLERK